MIAAEATPIRSVLVAGAGIVGSMAALAFRRALPAASIGIVATPPDQAALADRLPATLPATNELFDLIGIAEDDLVRAGAATHRLADRFTGWRADGGVWLHGFGDTGVAIEGAAFHQHWADARRAKSRTAYEDYSPAAALARAGRFAHPDGDERSLLSRIGYALDLDAEVATRLFAGGAAARNVASIAGGIAAVLRDGDGSVAAIRLGDGRTLGADLFVDCTGPAALLAGTGDRDDWSDALPVDRLLIGDGIAEAPTPLADYKALATGWRATWRCGGRAVAGVGYAEAVTGEARARRVFGAGGDTARLVRICAGRQRSPWRGNVLALGEAAVQPGALGTAGFGLAQSQLALSIELLPGRDLCASTIAEYNRRATARADRVRDLLALHYHGARGLRGEFWQAMRDRTPPTALADTLAIFARHGNLPRHEEELYDKQDWLAVLLGLGLVPEGRDPIAMGTDADEVRSTMTRLAAAVAALPASLPPYPDYLARLRQHR